MATSPAISKRAGRLSDAPKVSLARTAYPSMVARAKCGTGSDAEISEASLLPQAEAIEIRSGGNGRMLFNIDKTSSAVLTLRNLAIR